MLTRYVDISSVSELRQRLGSFLRLDARFLEFSFVTSGLKAVVLKCVCHRRRVTVSTHGMKYVAPLSTLRATSAVCIAECRA